MGLVILLLLLGGPLFAAAPDTLWTHRYGGSSWDAAVGGRVDAGGNCWLVGQTQSYGPAGANGYLVQVAGATGDTVFTRWYGGASSDDFADIFVGASQILAVGTTGSYGPNPGNAWLVCMNLSGDTLWTRAFDIGDYESLLAVDHDGGYVAVGSYDHIGAEPDLLVLRYSDTGLYDYHATIGGAQLELGLDVLALPDGGCIAVGETYSFGAGTPSYGNAWMLRFDYTGDTLWTRTFGGATSHERANAIIATADGGYALVGYREQAGDQDVWLLKTDSSGMVEWERTYGGAGDDVGMELVSPCDEGYLIGGYTYSYGAGSNDVYVLRVDAAGDTLWTAVYGGSQSDLCYAVGDLCTPWSHGGYVVAGATRSGSYGAQDAWLIRLDAEPRIEVSAPGACQEYVVGDLVTVQWTSQGLATNPSVRVELARDYPQGSWESVADSLPDTGWMQFVATSPASGRCAVRVSQLHDSTVAGMSSLFRIRPPGNYNVPLMAWDSSYTGGIGMPAGLTTQDGGYAYPWGAGIVKRDSVGQGLWTVNFPYNEDHFTAYGAALAELTSGDLVLPMIHDSAHAPGPSFVVIRRAEADGTPWVGALSYSVDGHDLEANDIVADDSDGYWMLGTVRHRGSGFPVRPYVVRVPAGGGGWADTITFEGVQALRCALADSGGLLIAGRIGDDWVDSLDIVLIRIEGSGDTLWTRRLAISGNERVTDMIRLADGSYALLAKTYASLASPTDALILIVDAQGGILQQWTYDAYDLDDPTGIVEDTDGGLVVSAFGQDYMQHTNARLSKFGCGGGVVWQYVWGHGEGQGFSGVDLTPDGGYMCSGYRYYSGGGSFGTDRPNLTKYGPESWTVPPPCPPADSLVIQYNPLISANVLTWQGDETGVYYVYASEEFDSTGGGAMMTQSGAWDLIGCVEPIPPARSAFQFVDTNLTPLRKYYYVVHDCNGSCGGEN